MPGPTRIYLDNAATSWPKPEAVYAAVEHYQREVGAPAGRSAYAEAALAERAVEEARAAIAGLLAVDEPRRILFTANGTDALNLAIHGLLRTGDHVVTTVLEHNSVLRPLRHLEDAGTIRVTRVGCDPLGVVRAADIRAALRPETRLVALIHASNVTGALQPAAEVGEFLRKHPALFLLDAAQSLGHLPVDFGELGCDLLAAPGHKGLLGPLGTGILALGPGAEQHLSSTRQGGTGTHSEEDRQPVLLPDKYESGNHNMPGIIGLAAGVAYLRDCGLDVVCRHDQALAERLLAGLAAIDGVTVFGPPDAGQRVGVVSVQLQGYDPQEVAATLDAHYRIQVRAGIHCAPLIHRALGTLEAGGTLRLSLSPLSTDEHVDAAIAALREIAAASLTV